MKPRKPRSIAHVLSAAGLAAAATSLLAPQGQAGVVSDPATASKVTVGSGATFVAPAGRNAPAFRGQVASVSGNTLTIAGSPGWTANQFAPATVGSKSFYQYMVILRSDRSADGPGNQGDWWLVDSNGAATVTVAPSAPAFGTTASRLGAGDTIEIIKLTSIKDLFGAGPTLRINPDTDFDDTTGDYLRVVSGTSFVSSLMYHDGSLVSPAGWYLDFEDMGDGSQVTLYPDQAIMVFHQGAVTDLHSGGTLQSFALTHYLNAGANSLATGFGKDAPLATSRLQAAGFLDTDFDDTTEDYIRLANGTSFTDSLMYHDGSLVSPAGWYLNFSLAPNAALSAAAGFFLFADGNLTWRQPPPFVP
jgi:uncharacterized protein (TIGR02597 family)